MRRKPVMHLEQFSNYHTFIDTCDARDVNPWATSRNRKRSAKWAGESYDDARRLLEYGDGDAVKALTPCQILPAESVKPRKRADVCGYAPIVPAAIIGLPKTMRRRVKTPTRSKVVTLVIDVTGSFCVKSEEFMEAGRELCAFIRGAEAAGYSIGVDVLGTFQEGGRGDMYACRVTIKRPDQALDIKRVCYPLAHSSMLRQLFFDWYERFPNATYIQDFGFPLRHESDDVKRRFLSQILKPNEHYCGLLDRDFAAALK